jgi:hypothetical protein
MDEYFKKWNEYYIRLAPKGMRIGQAAFNVLVDVRPDLADRVRGSFQLDPFHKDANLPALLEWIFLHWNDGQ